MEGFLITSLFFVVGFFIIYYIISRLYYYIRDNRIENFKIIYAHDDNLRSHFGCEREEFYKK